MYAIKEFIPWRNSGVRWLCPPLKYCVDIIAATKGHSYISNPVFPQQVTITLILAICTSAGHGGNGFLMDWVICNKWF